MHDGRMYYSVRETSTDERDTDYEIVVEYIE